MNLKESVAVIVFGMVVSAQGATSDLVQVNWESSGYMADDQTNYLTDASYEQLLWSSDASPYDTTNYCASVGDPAGTLYGVNDYLLDSVVVPAGEFGQIGQLGNTIGVQYGLYSNANVGGNVISVGYIYSIIFANTNLSLGTWTYVSGFSNASFYAFAGAPPPVNTFNATPGTPPFTAIYDFQLVPEPSTWAIYGLGTITLAMWRRRRRK